MFLQILKAAEEKRARIQKNLKRLKKRVAAGDEFMRQHKYSWDWVFVFKVAEADEVPTPFQKRHSVRNVISKLCEAGLQTSMFYSVQQDEVYCKVPRPPPPHTDTYTHLFTLPTGVGHQVRAHPDRLKAEADRIDMQVPLDESCLKVFGHDLHRARPYLSLSASNNINEDGPQTPSPASAG